IFVASVLSREGQSATPSSLQGQGPPPLPPARTGHGLQRLQSMHIDRAGVEARVVLLAKAVPPLSRAWTQTGFLAISYVAAIASFACKILFGLLIIDLVNDLVKWG
ncbi:hypothetical protein THAOC_29575, partial [Thalassiosira oceanica]